MSTPFMQLYVADYLGDTQHLTTEQHGAYLLLLMSMWRSGGKLANDQQLLARIVRLTPAKWRNISDIILAFFEINDAEITQKRLISELEKANKKSIIRASAGRAGGIAKALKDKQSTVANATVLPQHSSEPEPEPDSKKEDTSLRSVAREAKPKFSPPSWVPQPQWTAFLEMRKKLHAPMTNHAMDLTIAKLDLFRTKGHDPGAVLDQSVERGWKGVFELKSEDSNGYGGNKNGKSGATSAHQSFLAGGLLALAGDGMSPQDIPEPVNDPPRLAISR